PSAFSADFLTAFFAAGLAAFVAFFSAMTTPHRGEPLAARWPGLRLALALEIERHCSANEILQGSLIDRVAVVDVDGAPDIPVEAGVEETCRILQRNSLGKCHLDDVLVRLSRADDAAVGPDRRSWIRGFHPLPLLDDLRVCIVADCAHLLEPLPS